MISRGEPHEFRVRNHNLLANSANAELLLANQIVEAAHAYRKLTCGFFV